MAMQKRYSTAAERQAAYRARNVTPADNVTLDNVTPSPSNVTDQANVTPHSVTIEAEMKPEPGEAVTIEPEALDDATDDAAPCSPGFVAFKDCRHVPHDGPLWAGAGRGTPRTYQGARFVLVARGTVDPTQPEHGVVTLADWSARLAQHCAHGFAGWSCHVC